MTRTLSLAAAVVLTVLAAATTPAVAGCQTRACEERVAAKQCSQKRVVPCIRRAALRWRVDFQMLLRKARCESKLDPYAQNPSGSSGLFQFLPSTWATTPYRRRSIWRAKWNALAAAWAHSVGRGGEWVCE